MGGSGGGANTIIESPLPDYAQSQVEVYLASASRLSNEVFTAYTGTTYALRDANEIAGITKIATRATYHHAIITKGETLLRAELDGSKFNVNPKLADWFQKRVDEAIEEFEEETIPTIENQFLLAGRFGGGAHNIRQVKEADKLTKRIAQIAEDTWARDNFEEKERQVASLGTADNYGTEDIRDAEMLRQAGLYEREYYQGLYDDSFRAWKEAELADVKRLEILGNAIRACVGAQVVTTTPYYRPKPFAQLTGIAMAGVGLYATFYGRLKSKETTTGDSFTWQRPSPGPGVHPWGSLDHNTTIETLNSVGGENADSSETFDEGGTPIEGPNYTDAYEGG